MFVAYIVCCCLLIGLIVDVYVYCFVCVLIVCVAITTCMCLFVLGGELAVAAAPGLERKKEIINSCLAM